jgi:hypothetical protein
MQWQAVDVDTPLGELHGPYAVAATGSDGRRTTVLVQVGRPGRRLVRARVSDTATRTPEPVAIAVRAPSGVTLRELVLAHTGARADAAAVAPRLKWPGVVSTNVNVGLLAGGLGLTVLGLVLQYPSLILFTLPMLLVGLFQRRMGPANGPARIVDGGRDVLPTNARALIPHQPAPPAGPSPAERVARAAYGGLLGDVVYRIENSALFDGAFPPTADFQLALALWDEASPDADALARDVETTFASARARAEELGLGHLPETARDPARRAAKAAATALAGGPEPERDAARRRVAEILGSLALYYLPPIDATAPALIGARRQIEPAP